jgi:NAD(P)H-flavin reductase
VLKSFVVNKIVLTLSCASNEASTEKLKQMKNKSIVKVTDERSEWFGRTGRIHKAVNQNRLLVDIDGQRVAFMAKQLEQVRNVYTPPIVNESSKRLAVAIERVYNEAKLKYDIAVKFDSDYARGQANTAKVLMDDIKAILDGKY